VGDVFPAILLTNLAVVGKARASKRAKDAETQAARERVWERERIEREAQTDEADAVHARLEAVVSAAVAEVTANLWQWPVVDGTPVALTLYQVSWLTGMARDEDGAAYVEREEGWSASPAASDGWRPVYPMRYVAAEPRRLALGAEHLVIVEEQTFRSLDALPYPLAREVAATVPGILFDTTGPDGVRRYAEVEGCTVRRVIGREPVPWVRALLDGDVTTETE
jgi:hypothetical protein